MIKNFVKNLWKKIQPKKKFKNKKKIGYLSCPNFKIILFLEHSSELEIGVSEKISASWS
jgi:hypothetical protein